ncbi:MAG: hypothetical protein NXI32_29010 [bacterium]|nr:hypothetical protein [bacterium]
MMKLLSSFHLPCPMRFGLALAAAALSAVSLLIVDGSEKARAQEESPKTGDAVQERVYSGPQPGEEIKPFKVYQIQDGDSQELEIIFEADDRIRLICFVHRLSDDDRILFGLGLVDFYALRHDDLTSHIVLLSDDRETMLKMLQGWSRGNLFPKSLLGVSVDGAEGPGAYGLNRNVAMTVLVAKGNKVVKNLVFNAPNGYDLETIMKAVATTLGKEQPTLTEVQQELRAERQRQAEERLKASPVFQLAPNEQLGRIMFGMVNARGNPSQNAQRLSQQLTEWAGDSQERQSELQKYCQAVLAGDFSLNRYSRAALQELAED